MFAYRWFLLMVAAAKSEAKEWISHLAFDGDASDRVNGVECAASSGVTFTKDRFGEENRAVLFEDDGVIVCPEWMTKAILGSSPRTICLWSSSSDEGEDRRFMAVKYGDKQGKTKRCSKFEMRYSHDKNNLFFVGGNCRYHYPTKSRAAKEDEWVHRCLTYDGEALMSYRDGMLEDSYAIDLETSGPTPLLIGAYDKEATAYRWRGKLDDVSFLQEALSPQEVEDLYQRTKSGASSAMELANDLEFRFRNKEVATVHKGQDIKVVVDFQANSMRGGCISVGCSLNTVGAYFKRINSHAAIFMDESLADDVATLHCDNSQRVDLKRKYSVEFVVKVPSRAASLSTFNCTCGLLDQGSFLTTLRDTLEITVL